MSSTEPRQPIVVVSHGFQSHYELGFVNGLAENGRAVVLLGSDTTIAARLHPKVELRNIRGSQDPKRPLWRKVFGMLRYQVRLFSEAVRLRGAPVVCIGMLNPEWWVGVLVGGWLSAWSGGFALVVHNLLPHDAHSAAMRRVYRIIYRIPRWLLVHTESTREALVREFGIARERVLLVPHGLNDAVPRAALTRGAAKAALGFAPDARTVLFFGKPARYKGCDLLVDALEQLPRDVRLIVAGKSGIDPYSAQLCTRLAELAASGRAWWRDAFIADDDIGPIFAAADVTVLPYRHIDQSGVLLLSLTLGVPVLTTPVGGFAELVDARNGAFIASADAEAVAEAITAFFAAPAPNAETVHASVAPFAWRHTLRPYLECLESDTEPAGADARAAERGTHS